MPQFGLIGVDWKERVNFERMPFLHPDNILGRHFIRTEGDQFAFLQTE
jgi:hypothetical protein